MISQADKFPTRTHLLAFRRTAKQIITPHLRVLYHPSPSASRLSIIVPKKLSKLATTRNWLKRLTYDAFYPPISDKKLDCVIIYKPLAYKKSEANKKIIIAEILSLILK